MIITYSKEQMLELIDINAPYFAFDEITDSAGLISAIVPVQQPLGDEVGPISAAEASRHLAILGVCSCALQNTAKKRHYYLAYRGIYERLDSYETSGSTSGTKLTGKASCISVDRKKAEAVTELVNENGATIIKLRIFYHVIAESIFERLYKEYYIANPDFHMENPFSVAHPFSKQQFSYDTMTSSMGIVPEFMCAGHFPHYPALPVAILVYNLFDLTNKLVSKLERKENLKNIIRSYEINADNLAFAGDKVDLQVSCISYDNNGSYELAAEGVANLEKSIGKINLILETEEILLEKVSQSKRNTPGSILKSVVKSLYAKSLAFHF